MAEQKNTVNTMVNSMKHGNDNFEKELTTEILKNIEDAKNAKIDISKIDLRTASDEIINYVSKLIALDPNKEYHAPEMLITVNDGRVATLGNISTIIGKGKGGKTYFISMIIAAILKAAYRFDQDFFKVNLPAGKSKIIWVDTEMHDYDIQIVIKRIKKLIGIDILNHIIILPLREYPPDIRLRFVVNVIQSNPDAALAVIDGIRDLGVDPILDAREANDIVAKMMQLSKKVNIHIMSVLHQNKTNDSARGHIGTELINKSETVLSVEKDKSGIRIVKPEACRGKEIEQFAFNILDDGTPVIMDQWESEGEKEKEKKPELDPYQVPREKHLDILKAIFNENTPSLKRKDLEAGISLEFKRHYIRLSSTRIVEFIKYYRDNGMVKDSGGKGRYGNTYYLNHF